MSLANVWIDTMSDGLIRADLVAGIHTHRTPALVGKPPRWLVDITLPVTTGSGTSESWSTGSTHRTLAQTDRQPSNAPRQLARLLAQLDTTDSAGIISTTTGSGEPDTADGAHHTTGNETVRFRFTPFDATEPGRHYDAQYL
jgi:hypothetical protein